MSAVSVPGFAKPVMLLSSCLVPPTTGTEYDMFLNTSVTGSTSGIELITTAMSANKAANKKSAAQSMTVLKQLALWLL